MTRANGFRECTHQMARKQGSCTSRKVVSTCCCLRKCCASIIHKVSKRPQESYLVSKLYILLGFFILFVQSNLALQLPRRMLSMYLHAYQSYVWNHVVSERIKRFGCDKPLVGDIVLEDTGNASKNKSPGRGRGRGRGGSAGRRLPTMVSGYHGVPEFWGESERAKATRETKQGCTVRMCVCMMHKSG